ncbi:hypothetical protein BDZ88DRAFT_510011 [Geranomyces variabilis]|nr:hypothetical protein BDZ88DRAFT_510011 [Geranomyces variabilis]KAJ3131408.1 hypothetical protein HDU90_008281 [Geranomyces variabilis]
MQHHENRADLATTWRSCDVDTTCLAFANLFPYLRHHEIWACVALLREWVTAIAPLILVTMGRNPSAASAAYFIHPYGLPERQYTSYVGLPFIATFADPIWTKSADAPPPGHEVLVIPHLHAGFVKYQQSSEARVAVLRVIDLTWQLTIAISFRALELVLYGVTPESRRRLKNALGAPGSPERIRQITVMWRRNYPDVQMHIAVPRSLEAEMEWKHWASSRLEGMHAAGTMIGGY